MPVYVDDMYKYPMGRFGRMKMSHMVADTREELLEMADKIGVARKWIQHPESGRDRCHFDVALSARGKAVAAGAIEMSMRDMAMMCMRWREDDREPTTEHERGRTRTGDPSIHNRVR